MNQERQERDAKIVKLAAQGLSYTIIGERLSVSRQTVSGVMFRFKHPDVKRGRRRMKEDVA